MNLDGSEKLSWVLLNRENFFFFAESHLAFNFFRSFYLLYSQMVHLLFCTPPPLHPSPPHKHTHKHTPIFYLHQPSTQNQMNGGKSAVLILDWQERWQLTVKINLCSCSAPSEGCPGVSRVRGLTTASLVAVAPQRSTPPIHKDRLLFFWFNMQTRHAPTPY